MSQRVASLNITKAGTSRSSAIDLRSERRFSNNSWSPGDFWARLGLDVRWGTSGTADFSLVRVKVSPFLRKARPLYTVFGRRFEEYERLSLGT